jgi:Periplasmic protein involved in polysaccharide export
MKIQKLHIACSKLLAAIAILFATTTLLTSALTHAQGYTPTAAQIEQFKRMPPAQQQALAKSMGVNLDDILGSLQGANAPQQEATPISGNRNAPNPGQSDVELNAREAVDTLSLEEDKETDALQEKLELFGYDIFQFGADTFSPATDIPIPADYVMGPGDSLTIQLYGKENSTHNLVLNRDGQVMFPNIGPVTLAGMSFSHVSQKIDDVVSQQMIGVKSSVSMGSLRTVRVFVMGDVNVAGSYVVGSLSTMTNAIFASGGITKIGSLRNIQLKRRGKIITKLDLYDLLLSGDTSKDARLLPGDVIFVPPLVKPWAWRAK